VLGHTHAPFDRVFGGKRFVNPGTLGMEGVRSSFCVLDGSGETEILYLGES